MRDVAGACLADLLFMVDFSVGAPVSGADQANFRVAQRETSREHATLNNSEAEVTGLALAVRRIGQNDAMRTGKGFLGFGEGDSVVDEICCGF